MVNVDLLISTGVWLSGLGMTALGLEMTGDSKAPNRKAIYRTLFGVLGVTFLWLSYMQSDRADRAAREMARQHQEEQIRTEGEVKYTQGQLDSVSKVLGILASNSDPKQVAIALRSVVPVVVQPHNVETRFSRFSNSQLRDMAIRLAQQIRAVGQNALQSEMNGTAKGNSLTVSTNAQFEYSNKYKTDAIVLRDEILSRLPLLDRRDSTDSMYQFANNANGLFVVADDLETIAKKLPN